MKKSLVFIFFLLSSLSIYAECNIELFSSTYYSTGKVLTTKQVIKSSSCDTKINHELTNMLASANGNLNTEHLKRIIQEKNSQQILITPKYILVSPISSLIPTNLLKPNQLIAAAEIKFQDSVIHLSSEEKLKVIIGTNKLIAGKQTVKFNLTNITTGHRSSLWVHLYVTSQITALISTSQIMAYSPLRDIKTKIITVESPENFITNLKDIHFYQARTLLLPGKPLQHHNISPIILVKAGTPVKVILKNKGITLITTAIPFQNGTIGKQVTLRNIKSGKSITATVSNFNEVEITL